MTEAITALNVRAVLFQEGEWWCAQCLEYDITAQAKTLADLRYELDRVLFSHMCVSRQLGREPFAGLERAPPKFWKMYEDADLRLEGDDDLLFQVSDSDSVPPVVAKMKIAELTGDC